MQQFGLLGGKLGHSLSPQIHQLFFAFTGKNGTYDLLETELAALPARMESVRQQYLGCNVTIPHKLHVMPFLESITPEAQAIGAVNTIKFTQQGAFGYNTDYFGFGRMLEYNDIQVAGAVTTVLGSGGAARAVVKYLSDQQAAKIYLVTRDPQKIDPHFQQMAAQCEVIAYEALKQIKGKLLVNCTPLGMYPKVGVAAVDGAVNASYEASVDLVYNPQKTLFLEQAEKAGKKFVNGLFMLVAQAVAAQEIWQDEKYDSELIVQIMQELEKSL